MEPAAIRLLDFRAHDLPDIFVKAASPRPYRALMDLCEINSQLVRSRDSHVTSRAIVRI